MKLPRMLRSSIAFAACAAALSACSSSDPPASSAVQESAATTPEGEQTCTAAQQWVEANRDRLPTRYDDVAAHSPQYRKRIVAALEPQTRVRLWTEHLSRYRATHPALSQEQLAVLDDIAQAAAASSTFETTRSPDVEKHLQELHAAAVKAFGKAEAGNVAANLGPADAETSTIFCKCSTESDYCAEGCILNDYHCSYTTGCGFLWNYICNGMCGCTAC